MELLGEGGMGNNGGLEDGKYNNLGAAIEARPVSDAY